VTEPLDRFVVGKKAKSKSKAQLTALLFSSRVSSATSNRPFQ
jgi:hypothetical protein